MQLVRFSRWAIIGSFVVGAFITPGPETSSQFLVASALIGLYFLSVGLSFIVASSGTSDVAAGSIRTDVGNLAAPWDDGDRGEGDLGVALRAPPRGSDARECLALAARFLARASDDRVAAATTIATAAIEGLRHAGAGAGAGCDEKDEPAEAKQEG